MLLLLYCQMFSKFKGIFSGAIDTYIPTEAMNNLKGHKLKKK